ncbi:MAG TPA: hypothetical protein VKA32_04780 [Gammaproteobacteria bacterium]|nr:hypothetical protein [Gammaproteobacteria bacterium]
MPRITIVIEDTDTGANVITEAEPPLASDPDTWTPAQALGVLLQNIIDEEIAAAEKRRKRAAGLMALRILSDADAASRNMEGES